MMFGKFEKDESSLPLLPSTFVPRHIPLSDFLAEISKPASRFKRPFSLKDRWRLFLGKWNIKHSFTSDAQVFVPAGAPLNWQVIFNYLYKQGFLEEPLIHFTSFRNDKPKKPAPLLTPHFDAAVTDSRDREYWGHGTGLDTDESISKALGELLERHVGTLFKRKEFLLASPKELALRRRSFLNPSAIHKFQEWQKEKFPALAFSEESPFRWVEGVELHSNKKTLIPAQLAFWMYLHAQQGETEPMLMPVTTNGMAGHFTKEEATIAAIHEYIQRDNFLIFWLNTLSPKRINIAQAGEPEFRDIETYLRRFNTKAYFLNITTDTQVPTVLCVLIHNETGDSVVSVGSANGHSAKEAIITSYFEAVYAQSSIADARDNHTSARVEFASHEPFVRTDIGREERIRLWHGKECLKHIQFLITGEEEAYVDFSRLYEEYLSFNNAVEELQALVKKLRALGEGYEVYRYEMKHPVLTTLGYHVVKVIIPELLSLHLSEHQAMLGASRLSTVPKKLGYTSLVRNIYPHPFP